MQLGRQIFEGQLCVAALIVVANQDILPSATELFLGGPAVPGHFR